MFSGNAILMLLSRMMIVHDTLANPRLCNTKIRCTDSLQFRAILIDHSFCSDFLCSFFRIDSKPTCNVGETGSVDGYSLIATTDVASSGDAYVQCRLHFCRCFFTNTQRNEDWNWLVMSVNCSCAFTHPVRSRPDHGWYTFASSFYFYPRIVNTAKKLQNLYSLIKR